MAKQRKKSKAKRRFASLRWLRRWLVRLGLGLMALMLVLIVLFRVINPPTTFTMLSESRRLGGIEREWVPVDRIAPVMLRSAVAAEDAGFCTHWGFDMNAIRDAIADGASRGGSTISQQVVKNVFLWQGRSWVRKAFEAALTPVVEAVWPKRRILEVYLNVAEFDEGVFGIEAAALHYFGVTAADLSPAEAARLAAILPSPKTRSAADPTAATRSRAAQIADGAVVIARDGRAACFEAE
ncbi:monofunctional biosynthetic peptidoglycan transglycosylase [Citreimonas sp.]|uniref:monofunctional biosynthetic peptidoglycan transglycosylase n=1 Tax=Citreimonas sp. TaxID=3036715 RepID=UPI00405A0AB1